MNWREEVNQVKRFVRWLMYGFFVFALACFAYDDEKYATELTVQYTAASNYIAMGVILPVEEGPPLYRLAEIYHKGNLVMYVCYDGDAIYIDREKAIQVLDEFLLDYMRQSSTGMRVAQR